jgi:uncharacterized protein (TIGR00661 family)
MKKILISICGVGLGHATRVYPIIKGLRGKARVRIFASGIPYQFLKQMGLEVERLRGFEFTGSQFSFNLLLTLLENIDLIYTLGRDYGKIAGIAEQFKPDLIFSDSEPASIIYAMRRGIPSYILTNLPVALEEYKRIPRRMLNRKVKTQYYLLKKLVDNLKKISWLVVPVFERYPKQRKTTFVEPIVRRAPDELPSEGYLRRKLGAEDFYLVSLGGSSIGKRSFDLMLRSLARVERNFVIASNYAFRRKRRIGNLEIHPFIGNYLEYLKICRGVICLAGYSTICENLAYQKPSLVIPIKDHVEQLANAILLRRKELAKVLFLEEIRRRALLDGIAEFLDEEEEIRAQVKQFECKARGCRQVISLLLS